MNETAAARLALVPDAEAPSSGIGSPPGPSRDLQEGLVAASVYADGRKVAELAHIEDATAWKREGHVVWIGMHDPTDELLARVQRQFDLHELAIEDASNAHQRPKVEQYGEALFVVARTAQMVDGRAAFGETHIFVGDGYVISVRHGASRSYGALRARSEACPRTLAHGEDFILYAILDFIVDDYRPVLDSIHDEVETIEDDILAGKMSQDQIERIYHLRRDLLRLRNAVVPMIDVCRRLEHADVMPIDAEMQPLFRDVTDHVHRVEEDINSLREVLAFAFEASLSMGQAQQNDITRRLASWAAILAVPTAIAGVYGMNFKNMPELDWHYGYFVVLGAIVSVCTLLYLRLRAAKWL